MTATEVHEFMGAASLAVQRRYRRAAEDFLRDAGFDPGHHRLLTFREDCPTCLVAETLIVVPADAMPRIRAGLFTVDGLKLDYPHRTIVVRS